MVTAVSLAGLLVAAAAARGAPPAGAAAGPPVIPHVFAGDLRMLPPAGAWHAGDAIVPGPPRRHTHPESAARPARPRQRRRDALLDVQTAGAPPGAASPFFTPPDLDVDAPGFTGAVPPDTVGDVGPTHRLQPPRPAAGRLSTLHGSQPRRVRLPGIDAGRPRRIDVAARRRARIFPAAPRRRAARPRRERSDEGLPRGVGAARGLRLARELDLHARGDHRGGRIRLRAVCGEPQLVLPAAGGRHAARSHPGGGDVAGPVPQLRRVRDPGRKLRHGRRRHRPRRPSLVRAAGERGGAVGPLPGGPPFAGPTCVDAPAPVCGNGVREVGEDCDGTAAPFCTGLCRPDCTCPVPVCGNDVVELGEECDGTAAGPCATGGCRPDCTCAQCPASPSAGCRTAEPGRSTVQVSDQVDDTRDTIRWVWRNGAATDVGDFADPVHGSASYALCIFDGSGRPQPLTEASMPAGGTCGSVPCWKATSTGFAYRNRAATPAGVTAARLKAGPTGSALVQVTGKGTNLATPDPSLTLPVTVQLLIRSGATTQCWETRYTAARQNDDQRFTASGP